MRPRAEYNAALYLVQMGLNDCQIGRILGINRRTICDWRRGNVRRSDRSFPSNCPRCDGRQLDGASYAYPLGLYLGDGMLSLHPREVFRLRIVLDLKYPGIIESCARAIAVVRGDPNKKVSLVPKIGCLEVSAYWKHWPCLFPQHGRGRKHLRPIRLEPWQEEIVARFSKALLVGLVHSDGSRDLNMVKGKSYPRYQFVNHSEGIRDIFEQALERLGVRWTRPSWRTVSISRRRMSSSWISFSARRSVQAARLHSSTSRDEGIGRLGVLKQRCP